ncbi:MAG: type I restriction endonuclease [Dysgonomonas sp.]|nr:type I restriction endonuclease [Dysgonomonas sp.]
MAFNEDSRVKLPALLHLTRLGYTYISRKEQSRDQNTNIFDGIFLESIQRINPDANISEIEKELGEIKLKLDYDDLGKDFYQTLVRTSGIKLFDFKNIENNSFHVTTELTCKNEDEEFRPDITLIINGLPLVFIEVKKPNNKDGVLAERERMIKRFRNSKFKRFANITQLMIFSNNMEYEDGVIEPVLGAYYATSSTKEFIFNYFREEENLNLYKLLSSENSTSENTILKDNNVIAIKHSPEYITNKHYGTPTNRILTSLLNKERLAFILKYGIAYVESEEDGVIKQQKHVMRYPQLFATKAIEQKLDAGIKKGIIWHTQGSGKTALAYFNVKFLTDYFQQHNIIAKFYFIVDRIDLADQATGEFASRGLDVKRVDSRQDFIADMKAVGAIHNSSGRPEISVVNIQKFTEESTVSDSIDYDVRIQRIYFIDEAHRSYKPSSNNLVNLINSDKDSIKIALTGTPLLREVAKDYDSKDLFGDYIHKYYYNMSIADGYTLRLIRENIETSFKMQMKEIMEQIQIIEGAISTKQVFTHPKFVKPMLDYMLNDLETFRKNELDESLGAMVVCDSSEQAKELFAQFELIYGIQIPEYSVAAEPKTLHRSNAPQKPLKAALILHDVGTKQDRKQQVKNFKDGKIDILFVYNMLLTGFDAKRLKKLYLARVVHDHNLLQTLTRVNRPYKKYQYGYVVDFADITKAFDKTNESYLKELNSELGDENEHYSKLFKSEEEIKDEIEEIKDKLFEFDTLNAEIFQQQISEIKDKKELYILLKVLTNAKELKNSIRYQGYEELLQKLDFNKLNNLLNEVKARIASLNLIDSINNESDTTNLLNEALENVLFIFTKVSENELVLADELKNQMRQTREALLSNFDQKDPAFITLKEELERIFKKKKLEEVTQEEMTENILLLKSIQDRVTELNRKNNLLKAKYDQDEKYARVHKRLRNKKELSDSERRLYEALMAVKKDTDEYLSSNENVLSNEAVFKDEVLSYVITQFIDNNKITLDFETTDSIKNLITNEYYNDYRSYTSR